MSAKKVVLLGSTGSIGSSTLSVAREVPERLELVGLAAANSVAKLAEQVAETGVKHVGIYNAEKEAELRGLVPDDVEIYDYSLHLQRSRQGKILQLRVRRS